MASHYVILYTATAGANGPLLGTDEEDIVLMQYLVWDAACRKVVIFPYRCFAWLGVNLYAVAEQARHRCCGVHTAAAQRRGPNPLLPSTCSSPCLYLVFSILSRLLITLLPSRKPLTCFICLYRSSTWDIMFVFVFSVSYLLSDELFVHILFIKWTKRNAFYVLFSWTYSPIF